MGGAFGAATGHRRRRRRQEIFPPAADSDLLRFSFTSCDENAGVGVWCMYYVCAYMFGCGGYARVSVHTYVHVCVRVAYV